MTFGFYLISEETGEGDKNSLACSPLCGEWVCTMKISYPFIKYIPVVIVMSVSHVSRYAMSWMGIEATKSHRQKDNGLRLSYPYLRSEKYRVINISLLLIGR